MRYCDCEQCKIWTALEADDRSRVEHAFSLLGVDGGHYEGYGDSYAGAGACYILRVGSRGDTNRLARLIREDAELRCRIARGLWQEYQLGHKHIARIFELSDYDERFEIIVTIDIRASELFDVRALLRLLFRMELKPWEEVLLRMTEQKRHWA